MVVTKANNWSIQNPTNLQVTMILLSRRLVRNGYFRLHEVKESGRIRWSMNWRQVSFIITGKTSVLNYHKLIIPLIIIFLNYYVKVITSIKLRSNHLPNVGQSFSVDPPPETVSLDRKSFEGFFKALKLKIFK